MNNRLARLAVPIGIVGIVLLLVVPVPAPLMDFLIVCNILLALLVLLTSMFVKKPLDFSVFPSLLLVITLFRLGLNVASTRLVLGEGYAGQVIEAFGQVTVGGSIVIGAVVFLILVVIQFVVVTKGAERVAEVGARFTLDAMPGKQMAIDADLNAGLLTDTQARDRRAEVSAEADFYGAMDGASKFVKGDAIAGIIIIIINFIGGIAIGMLQGGMPIGDALNTYGLLTMGDGLVSQIPALLMAVATGMIVTRSNAESDMGRTASSQLMQSPNALAIAGVAAIAMALIPGMPPIPFVLVGAGMLLASRRITAQQKADEKVLEDEETALNFPEMDPNEKLLEDMRIHPVEILLAPDLVDMVSGASDDLLARVRSLRHKIAMELGLVIPPVRTRDSVDLPPATYSIRIAGVEAGRGTAPGGQMLALGDSLDSLPGTAMIEPVFGLAGKWIPAEMRHNAEMTGSTVIDRVSVLVTHLSSIVSANAARLLSREDVRVLTEGVRKQSPAAVDELTPALLSLAEVQRVLQGLLDEQVPINDLARIYEALTLRAKISTDPESLVESARQALGPALTAKFMDGPVLNVIMIDPVLEQSMLEDMRPAEGGSQIMMGQDKLDSVLRSVRSAADAAAAANRQAVLVCAPALRPAVRRLIGVQPGSLPVLSYREVTSSNVQIETVGVVRHAEPLSA
ncbi:MULTISPECIES: flagellar biosynthesis protein FlhA [Arthrobacter]|uniref:Flagellar type III secretion system protein FlhA n=1 Tax=Arthrobacter oryzae TaxID=409290 RepID=A0A3N0CDL4_9MICC|nr:MULTISPECIES: flagellar biosynthesis protein FlhA [Arthrobacter]QYF91246.1 flagellar biosynthesis protein FlhA [Arthrobacter sp. PAMC25284]RNL61544.1 flagellar type III secretion system protein FlhA [Arthrobacter oryzae]